jgi:hypothetical protein
MGPQMLLRVISSAHAQQIIAEQIHHGRCPAFGDAKSDGLHKHKIVVRQGLKFGGGAL